VSPFALTGAACDGRVTYGLGTQEPSCSAPCLDHHDSSVPGFVPLGSYSNDLTWPGMCFHFLSLLCPWQALVIMCKCDPNTARDAQLPADLASVLCESLTSHEDSRPHLMFAACGPPAIPAS
jgi:hypothetical protein